MNFLAHTLLAGDAASDRIGGLLGDFVKGLLPAGLPPDLAAGVALHRAIDSFADMCNEDGQLRLLIGRHNAACSPSLRLARHDLRIAGDGGGHGSRRASATWALWTCA